jgi:hypothetical protein
MAKPVKKGKGPAKLTKKTQSPIKNLSVFNRRGG